MIVPTRGGSAGVDADRLLERWGNQSWLPDELIVVRGAQNPAAARNLGADSTPAELLIFADDDGWPCNVNTLESIVKALLSDETVWLSGAAIQPPQDISRFQKSYIRQIPHNLVNIPSNTVEGDLATTLCCAIRRIHFTRLNGFDERLTAGEDPEFRDRLREEGGRVVLAGGAGVYHPPPNNLQTLWRRGYWYGIGNAQIAKHFLNDKWRKETRPKGICYVLFEALLSPTCLLLNWERLRGGKFKLRFQPLRMLHIWANILGYIRGRFLKAGRYRQEHTPDIEKHRFSPRH